MESAPIAPSPRKTRPPETRLAAPTSTDTPRWMKVSDTDFLAAVARSQSPMAHRAMGIAMGMGKSAVAVAAAVESNAMVQCSIIQHLQIVNDIYQSSEHIPKGQCRHILIPLYDSQIVTARIHGEYHSSDHTVHRESRTVYKQLGIGKSKSSATSTASDTGDGYITNSGGRMAVCCSTCNFTMHLIPPSSPGEHYSADCGGSIVYIK